MRQHVTRPSALLGARFKVLGKGRTIVSQFPRPAQTGEGSSDEKTGTDNKTNTMYRTPLLGGHTYGDSLSPSPQTGQGASNAVVTLVRLGDL